MRNVKISNGPAPHIGIDDIGEQNHVQVISPESALPTLNILDIEHNAMKREEAEATLNRLEEKPVDPTRGRLAATLIRLEDGHLRRVANKQILRGDSVRTAQALLNGEIAPQDADRKHISVANKLMGRNHRKIGRVLKSIDRDHKRTVNDIDKMVKGSRKDTDALIKSLDRGRSRMRRPARNPQREVKRVMKEVTRR